MRSLKNGHRRMNGRPVTPALNKWAQAWNFSVVNQCLLRYRGIDYDLLPQTRVCTHDGKHGLKSATANQGGMGQMRASARANRQKCGRSLSRLGRSFRQAQQKNEPH
jgi:hypothetical protein